MQKNLTNNATAGEVKLDGGVVHEAYNKIANKSPQPPNFA